MGVPQDERPPRPDVIDVPVAVFIYYSRPPPGLYERRDAPDGTEGPNRTVDTARQDPDRPAVRPRGGSVFHGKIGDARGVIDNTQYRGRIE
jgi:hypothetical protein